MPLLGLGYIVSYLGKRLDFHDVEIIGKEKMADIVNRISKYGR